MARPAPKLNDAAEREIAGRKEEYKLLHETPNQPKSSLKIRRQGGPHHPLGNPNSNIPTTGPTPSVNLPFPTVPPANSALGGFSGYAHRFAHHTLQAVPEFKPQTNNMGPAGYIAHDPELFNYMSII